MEDCTTLPRRPSVRVNLLHAHGTPTGYLYLHGSCRCVVCRAERAEYQRKHSADHPEKRREYERLYREANSEKIAASGKRWYEANRERAAATHKKWLEGNRERDAESGQRWYGSNRERKAATSKRWYEANKDRHAASGRARQMLVRYNTTPEEWDARFLSQGERCKCCGTDDPGSKQGWHTDHDHETGAVRGILCHGCNVGIGYLRDDPVRIAAALRYLSPER